MKIRKINEKREIDPQESAESLFYFLNHTSGPEAVKFIKSLNLTYDQYVKLEEIMSDYAKERYDDGRQDGLDQCQDYGAEY